MTKQYKPDIMQGWKVLASKFILVFTICLLSFVIYLWISLNSYMNPVYYYTDKWTEGIKVLYVFLIISISL